MISCVHDQRAGLTIQPALPLYRERVFLTKDV